MTFSSEDAIVIEFVQSERRSRRVAVLKFCSIMILVALLAGTVLYVTSMAAPTVVSYLGVNQSP